MLASGYWIIKGSHSYFIQHQVSSNQYLGRNSLKLSYEDFFIFGYGWSGLEIS